MSDLQCQALISKQGLSRRDSFVKNVNIDIFTRLLRVYTKSQLTLVTHDHTLISVKQYAAIHCLIWVKHGVKSSLVAKMDTDNGVSSA